MTLHAVEPTRMTIDPRRYIWCLDPELPDWCAIPGCTSKFKLQKHHIVRRSATGGPLNYITIDDLVVQNVCMLCREHHTQVTGSLGGHKLWITWKGNGWQVYRPGLPSRAYKHVRITKDGSYWVWAGTLQMGNHE